MDSTENLVALARKTAVVVGVALLLTVLVVGLGYIFNVLMVLFAGLILAILIRTIADFLNRFIPWDGVSVAVAVLILVGLFTGLFAFLAPQVAGQVDELSKSLPQSWDQATQQIRQYEWGQWLLEQSPNPQQLLQQGPNLLGQLTGILSTTLGMLATLIVICFMGIYLAVQPKLYVNGINRLVPISKRDRTHEVMVKIGNGLSLWLMGKLLAMVVVGVLVWLAMMLLGVPFALTLGVIAALFTFIPNFGPVISAIPAVLLGFTQGPMTALWVVLVFTAIQAFESYLLTPMIQQKAVSLPPAMLLVSQLVLGVFVGLFGLALAAPLGLVVLIVVRALYVHDLLGDAEAEPQP